jgi:endonuclease/exonuclease/phosphatase (EEP) superfamily protein YafD
MIPEMIFQLLALFVLLATLLPFVRNDHWMIRCWDFPRLQLFCLGLALFPFLFYFSFNEGSHSRDWIVVGMLVISVGLLGFWIWPYTKLHPKQVLAGHGKTGIRLLVSNILMTNRESEKLISLIREKQPDIFIVLEADNWWNEKLFAVAEEYPHSIELPQEDTYGMVIRSRIELIDTSVEYIIRKNIPSAHFKIKLDDGSTVRIHAVHPKPPYPDEDDTSTDR